MAHPPVVLHEPREVRALVRRLRGKDQPVVLVPTMGSLHEGHLSLVRTGAKLGPVVVSIFVNPAQFAPGEDFESYPRDLARDLDLLAGLPVTAVFAPEQRTLYPEDSDTWVEVERLSAPLCGAHRPGHFRGVTTVVAKLFGIVGPDVAVFGQKDAQQCLVLHRMTRDLEMPIELIFAPTVREPSGLALSSRNRYLDEPDRQRAMRLSEALFAGRDVLRTGERRRDAVEAAMREALADLAFDYAEMRLLPDLAHPQVVSEARVLLAVAAHVSTARLIDNLCLQVTAGEVREAPLFDDATLEAVSARLAAGRVDEKENHG
jgi:pantoate--beta-alanine ligase